jgi:hypothetical protein
VGVDEVGVYELGLDEVGGPFFHIKSNKNFQINFDFLNFNGIKI